MASVFLLPIPLLLLVHLHILDYPYANNPEYDHDLFSITRGLRDRTKSMEDICYFLVGKLEGRGQAKIILPTYPCLQPSDRTAFRTSLAKYAEALRHRNIYANTTGPSKGNPNSKEPTTRVAWWWKDVVVRKSLLEECSGDRFERLLLSLSTQALLEGTSASVDASHENAVVLLHSQPRAYATTLGNSQSTRHTWSRSASVLLQRQDDLKTLRQHLGAPQNNPTSQYSTLPADRLIALAESKHLDLLHDYWDGQGGHKALKFLIDLAGLKPNPSTSSSLDSASVNDTSDASIAELDISSVPPAPLPIAAAHHPSNLRKLRKPLFPSPKPTVDQNGEVQSSITPQKPYPQHAKIALSHQFDLESRTQQALADALLKAKKVGEDLKIRIKQLRKVEETSHRAALDLDLWENRDSGRVNFMTQPTAELISSFSLHSPPPEGALELRIDEIRGSLLPEFPPASQSPVHQSPETAPDRAYPTSSTSTSKIPSFSKPAPAIRPRTPEHYGHVITSTPPRTVKSKSVHSRTGLTSHSRTDKGTKVMGPRKSKTSRKSIRLSLVSARRSSLFTGNNQDNNVDVDDEVDRIIDAVQDESMFLQDEEEKDVLDFRTPKSKASTTDYFINSHTHTHTNSKTFNKSTIKRPKRSFPMPVGEPVALPSLSISSDDEWTDDEGNRNVPSSGDIRWDQVTQDDDVDEDDDNRGEYYTEAPSMTLREILLRADTTQFDLLDDDQVQLADDTFTWE